MSIDKIKHIIGEHLELDESSISEDSTFNDLGIDSSELVDIVISIENEFNIEIPNRTIAKFRSVKDITEYVEKS